MQKRKQTMRMRCGRKEGGERETKWWGEGGRKKAG